jgi:hypothetical protein
MMVYTRGYGVADCEYSPSKGCVISIRRPDQSPVVLADTDSSQNIHPSCPNARFHKAAKPSPTQSHVERCLRSSDQMARLSR